MRFIIVIVIDSNTYFLFALQQNKVEFNAKRSAKYNVTLFCIIRIFIGGRTHRTVSDVFFLAKTKSKSSNEDKN